jgi:hypothetical protein
VEEDQNLPMRFHVEGSWMRQLVRRVADRMDVERRDMR